MNGGTWQRRAEEKRNIDVLQRMLNENGEDPYILYELGKSFYMCEKYNSAVEYMEKALYFDLNPNLEYVIELIEIYGYA